MDVNRRERRIRRKLEDSKSKDRLSSLPDELLGRIVSFLPTKYAVATSALSSRWRNVYRLTSTLDFDDTVSFNRRDHELENRRDCFRKFVSRILEQCKNSLIHKFRFKCGDDFDCSLISGWIHAALSHKVVELELSIGSRVHCVLQLSQLTCQNLVVLKLDCNFRLSVPKSLTFPNLKVLFFREITFEGNFSTSICYTQDFELTFLENHGLNMILSGCSLLEQLVIVHSELYLSQLKLHRQLQLSQSTCKNLVMLKLDCIFTLCVPESVTFPSLKILFLKEITFKGNSHSSVCYTSCHKRGLEHHGLNGILSGCQMLEELVIIGCDWNGGDLCFTNPNLRSLTLEDGMSGPLDQLNGSTVYFDLPSLISFKYCVGLPEEFDIRDLDSVVEAQLVVCFNDDEYEEEQDLCNIILDLIGGICDCQFLHLSGQCLEALISGKFELPFFCNLTRLDLTLGCDVCWSDVLLDFLNSSPCLESLTLVQGSNGLKPSQRDRKFLLKAGAVPSCVQSRLKFVNINNFGGFKGEKKMVMYFLKNANVLEEMVIHWDQSNRGTDFLDKEGEILQLPKSSVSCSIAFK